jgi:hypothetical protein
MSHGRCGPAALARGVRTESEDQQQRNTEPNTEYSNRRIHEEEHSDLATQNQTRHIIAQGKMIDLLKSQQNTIGLSVASQNRRMKVSVGHASKSSGLFRVEASLARISQFGLKTGGGAMTGGARATIVKVASETS